MKGVVEERPADLPSDWFLWAAAFSLLASWTLSERERKQRRLMFGHWAPALLLFGLYNRLVIQFVSERTQRAIDHF